MSAVRRWSAAVTASGGLLMADPGRWAGFLAKMRGKRVWVTISPETETRNLSQNKYLWGVVYAALAEWSGHTPEEIHEAMKYKFVPLQELSFTSECELRMIPSTASLTVSEFALYVDKVKRFAAENGCYIPDPGEVVIE